MNGLRARFVYWWLSNHPWSTLCLALCFPALCVWWSFYDRESPVTFPTGGPAEIPSVRAGSEVTFDMPVERHLDRDCSMTVQRYLIDSTGAMRNYGTEQGVTAEGRRMREAMSPGRLRITILVPPSMPSGEASVLNESWFRCPANPSTVPFPISQSYAWKFKVLPPESKPAIVVIPAPASAAPLLVPGVIQP